MRSGKIDGPIVDKLLYIKQIAATLKFHIFY